MRGAATPQGSSRRDFRDVRDVRDGIIHDIRDVSARMVEYRPRKGSVFCVVLTDLSAMPLPATSCLGRGMASPYLVSVANFGRSFAMDATRGTSWQSVRKALDCQVTDAVVIAELLGYLIGAPCGTVDDFLSARGDLRA